ncbi:unnamed protein product [Rhizophagus irregularis]|nr:unnamed protein product [Rhizophagus irregularis]
MYFTKVLQNSALKNAKFNLFQLLSLKTNYLTSNLSNWKNKNQPLFLKTNYLTFNLSNLINKNTKVQTFLFKKNYSFLTSSPISNNWSTQKYKNVKINTFQTSLLRKYYTFPFYMWRKMVIDPILLIINFTVIGAFITTTFTYLTRSICLYLVVDKFLYPYINRTNKRKINERMEIGTKPEMDIPDSKFISRPEIAKYFEKIFQPDEDQSNYHIIYGNKGNGKTTLAKKMANEVGQGKFFDKAGVNKIDKLKRALYAFTKAAKIYKEQYDNPPVIIYDNIDNIDPKILEILQDDAEYNANNGTYIAVFICGGEKFTQILQSSRKSHIFEVEDLNKDESVNFLIQKLKISPEDADKIYGLVGGNIRELKFVAERLKNGELLEGKIEFDNTVYIF